MRRIALLLFVVLTGCSAWTEKSRDVKLDDFMRAYTRAMEWSDFPRAMHFRKLNADQPPPDLQQYRDIKISDYRPSQAMRGPDGKIVVRMAQVRYILLSRMSERSTTVQETWEYSEKDDRWYLTSELPVFPR